MQMIKFKFSILSNWISTKRLAYLYEDDEIRCVWKDFSWQMLIQINFHLPLHLSVVSPCLILKTPWWAMCIYIKCRILVESLPRILVQWLVCQKLFSKDQLCGCSNFSGYQSWHPQINFDSALLHSEWINILLLQHPVYCIFCPWNLCLKIVMKSSDTLEKFSWKLFKQLIDLSMTIMLGWGTDLIWTPLVEGGIIK